MRVAIMLGALAALATAAPYPQEQQEDPEEPVASSAPFASPTASLQLSTSLNVPVTSLSTALPSLLPTSTRSKNPHWEPIPVFTKQCQCNLATAKYPCWATDALQRCHYEENFSYGCYMEAAGGCPTPTRVCSDLFKPTPRPGPHPCELNPNPPVITDEPVASSPVAVWPSANVSLVPNTPTTPVAAWPTANITIPVILPTANVTLTLPLQSGSATTLA